MTSGMQRAIGVLDTLSLTDLKSADDAALRQFRELAENWAALAGKFSDRAHAREKK